MQVDLVSHVTELIAGEQLIAFHLSVASDAQERRQHVRNGRRCSVGRFARHDLARPAHHRRDTIGASQLVFFVAEQGPSPRPASCSCADRCLSST